MTGVLRIGNAGAFWGDRIGAAAELAKLQPDLDYITLDYLAEVSMSILARQRERNPDAGYAGDFIEVVRTLSPILCRESGRRLRIVTNAGGLNPRACAEACRGILSQAGCHSMRIGIVSGDDVLGQLKNGEGSSDGFVNLETGQPVDTILNSLVTANAYLGAEAILEVLRQGADIVITGRVADPSLTVGPCVHHFGWSLRDFDRLAGATVAGHLIECGTQVTGGISTHWLEVPDPANVGYPVAEVDTDGSCVITKPANTGGRVELRTVKEQLLYEIGDPDNYISPDAVVSFLALSVTETGPDRVRISGARGGPPTGTYKVSATYRAGYRASGTLTVFGRDAVSKARRCAHVVEQRLRQSGYEPQQWHSECLGTGDVVPGVFAGGTHGLETVLRLSVADERREVVDRFTRELMPLITCGPQGITGYAEGRPRVHEVVGYWPCLIDRRSVIPRTEILEV
jgi:Acyclic terpene utilisation family protein AtuA